MTNIGQPERHTQNRIVQLFREQLHYNYLGNWEDRPNNHNIEESLLQNFLAEQGHIQVLITRAIKQLKDAASDPNESLYNNNKNARRPFPFHRAGGIDSCSSPRASSGK